MSVYTVISRDLAQHEWAEMDKWLKNNVIFIGYKDVTWIMDSDALCFRTCITVDNAEVAALFKLTWC